MTELDPRLTPARPDLAARHLQGQVEAARFVDGSVREVIDASAPLRRRPSPDAPLDTEALCGERVTVYETTGEGWCWGQLREDGYVGYLPENALASSSAEPTHRVAALRTLVFPGPDIKLPPFKALSLGAKVAIARTDERFGYLGAGGCVPLSHIEPLDHAEPDFVAVAERFAGTPYLWGGKTSFGIDCSGLVQVSLQAAGIPCPRDSDMQERALGQRIGGTEALAHLRRGDLIFWRGHVAIARDGATIVHANAHHMAVEIEPVAEAVARIAAAGSEVASIRRI
ncbi:MAG: C40 family peptidase [Pseudorhodoplanes sp.]|nr:C40 family peptidase [Pseudorhodoplanes sp.]